MRYPEITSPEQLTEMANAFRVSRIILTAFELGIFNLLIPEGSNSMTVSGHLQSHPKATDRLLNALVALGLLYKHREIFTNTPFSAKYLVKGSPACLNGLALSNQTWKTWSTLTEAVFQGTSVAMEKPINERTDEWRESFIAAMHARAGVQAAEVAELLQLQHAGRVLDVGGGSGIFSCAMIRKNPGIRATVFDLPNIVPLTRKYVQDSGFSENMEVVVGDYLHDDLGRGFDLVFMSAIVHINSPEENALLIRKGADALNPGGQMVIIDHIMNDDRTEPAVGAFFALNMLVGTLHGDTYKQTEIRSWMLEAGLVEPELKITPSGTQVLVGEKAAY